MASNEPQQKRPHWTQPELVQRDFPAVSEAKTNKKPAHYARWILCSTVLTALSLWFTTQHGSPLQAAIGRLAPSGGLSPAIGRHGALAPSESSDVCYQTQPLHPTRHYALDQKLSAVFAEEAFKHKAYEDLGGAIRVPTESYDGLGPVGEDERWDIFGVLHEYLEQTFPRVFSTLNVTKVNTYGIVLHWQGSDESILPVLTAAHQDVVPVDPATIDEWIQPPYSGHYDGTWIWGRGTCDCKGDMVATLHAIDALIGQGFQPRRTFVWAYGFDEESAGREGAGHIAPYLEERYGRDGFAMLIDEGYTYGNPYGPDVVFANPALSEKGYLDVRIEISTKGGHSSTPPKHTAIGMLSSMIVALEAQPHKAMLNRDGLAYQSVMCAATYGPDFPADLRKLAQKAAHDDGALADLRTALVDQYQDYEALLRTTQAVDLVNGGVKVNALPEKVYAVVNHRIAEHSSVAELQAEVLQVILPVARSYGLSVEAFGKNVTAGSGKGGHVALTDAWDGALEPSPITPWGKDDAFQILSGTIKATIESSSRYNASGVIVAPLLALGNTDTQFYWNLTRNIFRYSHQDDIDRYNMYHTVNEAIRGEGWIETIRFHTKFILNCDEYV